MPGQVVRMRYKTDPYNSLVEQSLRMQLLNRPRREYDNITTNLLEISHYEENLIQLAQDEVQWWASYLGILNLQKSIIRHLVIRT
jgi:hypothetical protein